ncbi:Domain of unknown function DUF551 [uncultured Caudovirales phage]|uniref:DUF551 domain-containing protein n=1 Tax=uncultured Caudovirales phage TaxID=2100421 RepID=A0A6J7W827_9CAUD|nr:Domain of unknown function DUF551 [uncultured Caudovirales phage]
MAWKKIDSAPKDDTPVDLYCEILGGRLCNYERVDIGKGNIFYTALASGYTFVREATHWMPIPQPPEEE